MDVYLQKERSLQREHYTHEEEDSEWRWPADDLTESEDDNYDDFQAPTSEKKRKDKGGKTAGALSKNSKDKKGGKLKKDRAGSDDDDFADAAHSKKKKKYDVGQLGIGSFFSKVENFPL